MSHHQDNRISILLKVLRNAVAGKVWNIKCESQQYIFYNLIRLAS